LLAVAAGAGAALLYDRRMAAMPYDTSGGMYAAGESLTAIAVFLVVALFPTLLALWFLRRHAPFWQGVAIASLAFAAVGLISVAFVMAVPDLSRHVAGLWLSLFGLAQLLGVPFWTVSFIAFAALAPTRPARRLLIAAIAIELVIALGAAVHWFGPGRL
jgi:hypothetical protein